MPNLSSTLLAANVSDAGLQLSLASVGTIAKGDFVYLDGEACSVTTSPIASVIKVRRGANGTVGVAHAAGVTVYTGAPSQFYQTDPKGTPPPFPVANPWINVSAGRVWFAVGDQVGPGVAGRVWQLQTTTPAIGALGVRTPPPLQTVP